MSHPYVKEHDCACARCLKERARRAGQRAADSDRNYGKLQKTVRRTRAPRVASREEQHARYIDCGPQAWDDRE